jgi:hypothetical protein
MKIESVFLTESDQAHIARLAQRCASLRTAAVLNAVYADPGIQQLVATEPAARDRVAVISGRVVAEVAIARRSVARVAALLAVALLLVGCGFTRTQINPGARNALFACDRGWMEAELARRGGVLRPGRRLDGFHDRLTRESFVAADLRKYRFAAVAMHEAGGHANEERCPAVWDVLDSYDSPAFPCGSDALHDEQRALAEAKRATEAAE